jgi:hypothetical protein
VIAAVAAGLSCRDAATVLPQKAVEGEAAASATATPAVAKKAGGETRELDAPYVPTHQVIVDEMLAIGEVAGDDVLYDLGSGDGRIPITAAKRFGTRGVGIDLNPVRTREASRNARKAGVSKRVRFVTGDIFESDFSEATVLMIYLLPEVNRRLLPAILGMKPGTRVVSHNYDMGDWKPEKFKSIRSPEGQTHYIYFWRVPERGSEAGR